MGDGRNNWEVMLSFRVMCVESFAVRTPVGGFNSPTLHRPPGPDGTPIPAPLSGNRAISFQLGRQRLEPREE